MKRLTTAFLLTFTVASWALGDCTPNLRAVSTTNITIGKLSADCMLDPPPAPGDEVSIKAGTDTISTIVVSFHPEITAGALKLRGILVVASVDPEPDKLRLINDQSPVSVTVGTVTLKNVEVLDKRPNYLRYDWSVGPATSGDANGGGSISAFGGAASAGSTATPSEASPSDTGSGAIRLKLSAQYAKSGIFGTPVGTAQTLASVDIDTTDQNAASFIDNNRATLGFRWELPPTALLKQATIGFDGKAAKAIHRDIHDLDATVTISGWLPAIRTLNLFNRQGQFISAPLSFTASYGYRNRNLQNENFHGKVFEATALYHIFAADRYKVDLQGTWTVNDLTNRPASTPRSQRLYKGTISYLADPSKGFSVLTSFEDGSAGVMLTKVRQYFLGIALSKLNFSGKK